MPWLPQMFMVRILVVDDHPASLELIRAVLESAGYEVMEAQDGVEAIAAALRFSPDLVLMDLKMPRMDGFAALNALRKEPQLKVIPIVALTAQAMQGYGDVILQAGFSGYITKPLSLEGFRRQIRGFLDEAIPESEGGSSGDPGASV
jgi:CheY-like chemotaxis protein